MLILVEGLPVSGVSHIALWLRSELDFRLVGGEAIKDVRQDSLDKDNWVFNIGCFQTLSQDWLNTETHVNPELAWHFLNSADALIMMVEDPFTLSERIDDPKLDRPTLGALLSRYNHLLEACPIPAKGSYVLTRLLNADGTATEEGEKLLTDLRQLRDQLREAPP